MRSARVSRFRRRRRTWSPAPPVLRRAVLLRSGIPTARAYGTMERVEMAATPTLQVVPAMMAGTAGRPARGKALYSDNVIRSCAVGSPWRARFDRDISDATVQLFRHPRLGIGEHVVARRAQVRSSIIKNVEPPCSETSAENEQILGSSSRKTLVRVLFAAHQMTCHYASVIGQLRKQAQHCYASDLAGSAVSIGLSDWRQRPSQPRVKPTFSVTSP